MPRYSIITPTLVRSTLKRLCESIDSQTNPSWEHVVIIDCPMTAEKQKLLDEIRPDPRRKFYDFGTEHAKDFGNAARRKFFEKATGEYILHIDDDDYYVDSEVFDTLQVVTGVWAHFPVLAHGSRCFIEPPAIHHTGSAMFIYRRDTGCRFPETNEYSADGQLVEELKSKYKYQSLAQVRPLVIYEQANRGREQEEIDRERARKLRALQIHYQKDGLTMDWWDNH